MSYDLYNKIYLDYLAKVYQKTYINFVNHIIDINKITLEFLNQKAAELSKKEKEEVMPANGHDIYNYVARYGISNFQIQTVMKFDGHLDFQTLTKAVMLSIEEEPVFGCRFVEAEPPYWKRINNLEPSMVCSMEETKDLEQSIKTYLETPLDMDNDPMVKVKLLRIREHDTLCFKVNHSCCDGVGTIEYIKLVSDIYNNLNLLGIYRPTPRMRTRADQDRLFSELGITDPESEWISGSEITRATWPFPWVQVQSNTERMVVLQLDPGYLPAIRKFSRIHDVKVNDILLTAFYRAMARMGQPVYTEPMEIPVTIDLRRYLPDRKTESIRNFSGSEISRVLLVENETFTETLSKVASEMNRIKNSRGGLQSAIGLERVERLTLSETLAYYKLVSQWSYYCGDKCAPVLSNLGVLSHQLITFGERTALDFYIIPPVVRPPGLLLMAGTYNSVITLAVGIYEGTVAREEIEKLLGFIKEELTGICRGDLITANS